MKIKSIKDFSIPNNLRAVLDEEGFWEDETFDPILVLIEDHIYKGDEKTAYQCQFEVLDEFDVETGYDWEDIVRYYIRIQDKVLESRIYSDSEGSTCVLWVENENDLKLMLKYLIELLENETAVERISQILDDN